MWGCSHQTIAGPDRLTGATGASGTTSPTPTGPTLSGMVFEQTSAGRVPLSGIEVQAQSLYATTRSTTDVNGLYKLTSLPTMPSFVALPQLRLVAKGGASYAAFGRTVLIDGETRLDIELVRPGTYTLSGVLTEMTANGPVPVEGVYVRALTCDGATFNCSPQLEQFVTTGRDGAYRFSGVWAGQETFVSVSTEGNPVEYAVDGSCPTAGCRGYDRLITASVDTQLDLQLIRQ